MDDLEIICVKCKVLKPLNEFDLGSRDRYFTVCRKCKAEGPSVKVCGKCHTEKNVKDEFYKNSKNWISSRCKECVREYGKIWNKNNKERKAETGKKYREKFPEKSLILAKVWREKNPEKVKKSHQKYMASSLTAQRMKRIGNYNLTFEQYEQKLKKQQGMCAICGNAETKIAHGSVQFLSIDHDHNCCSGTKSCGRCVRDLLCHNCNMAIGFAKENPEILRNAALYVERWNES